MVAFSFAAGAEAAGPGDVQALVDRGTALFKAGEHAEALEQFEQAYAGSGEVGLQYVIGRCHEELGELEEAVRAYERFLGADAPAEAKAKAEAAVRLLRKRLSEGRLVVQVAPFGAEVEVDGRKVGQAPVDPLEVAPGEHTVVARAPGLEEGLARVVVPGGGEAVVTLELRAPREQQAVAGTPEPAGHTAPEAAVEASPAPGDAQSAWGWAMLGTGAAFVAGGAVTFALGEADHRAITSTEGYGTAGVTDMTRQRALALESDGYAKKTAGYVLWGVGGAALVTSVVLLATDGESEPGVALSAAPAPGGVVIGGCGRF